MRAPERRAINKFALVQRRASMMHQDTLYVKKHTGNAGEAAAPKREKRADFSYSKKNKPVVPDRGPVLDAQALSALPSAKTLAQRRASFQQFAGMSVIKVPNELSPNPPKEEERKKQKSSPGNAEKNLVTKIAKIRNSRRFSYGPQLRMERQINMEIQEEQMKVCYLRFAEDKSSTA